ncbi:MAG: CvpA family protein [Gammaproteobacteria bacterium]|nr:CvpA family protein [Gammaproteobacteria bacterium]MCW8986940.1 CvpA family protein [Gammaproteobacteria bacterium]
MVAADLIVLSIIVLSIIVSLMRGFVKEALSLAGWLVALWVAMTFSSGMAELIGSSIKDPTLRLLTAFVSLFILSLIVGSIVNFFATQFVQRAGLTGVDRTIGVVFGLLRGVLLVTIIVMLLGLTTLPKESWWDESFFMFRFEAIATWLKDLLPDDIARYFKY